MAQHEIKTATSVVEGLNPAAYTTTQDGESVDLMGYNSALVLMQAGVVTDGTFTPKVEHSDDAQSWADASSYLVGTPTAFTSAADEDAQAVAYLGAKRYIRAGYTVSGNPQTGGIVSTAILRGHPRSV